MIGDDYVECIEKVEDKPRQSPIKIAFHPNRRFKSEQNTDFVLSLYDDSDLEEQERKN